MLGVKQQYAALVGGQPSLVIAGKNSNYLGSKIVSRAQVRRHKAEQVVPWQGSDSAQILPAFSFGIILQDGAHQADAASHGKAAQYLPLVHLFHWCSSFMGVFFYFTLLDFPWQGDRTFPLIF